MFAYLSFISADSRLERGGEGKILGSREARGERGNNGRGGATFPPLSARLRSLHARRACHKSSLPVPFQAHVTQSTLLKVDDDDDDDFCDDGDNDDDKDLSSLISIT